MSARKEVPEICQRCGKHFKATQGAVNRGGGVYCCSTCRHRDLRKRLY